MSDACLAAGLHDKISAAMYHADPCAEPSLSSGIVRLLDAATPADAKMEHPRLGNARRVASPAMVFGGYVHALLADDVTEFAVGDFDDYRTKDARAWRDGVVLCGQTPILRDQANAAGPIVEALRSKAAAHVTNNPFTLGRAEVTAIWQDDGVWCRARYDRLVLDASGYADVWDWKTTSSGLSERQLIHTVIDQGYHIQAAHYLRGLRALLPQYIGRTSFIFAFVETCAPYKVRRVVLNDAFLRAGGAAVSRAITIWRECIAANDWPEYSADTLQLDAPAWIEAEPTLTGMTPKQDAA